MMLNFDFFKIKKIPVLFWSASTTLTLRPKVVSLVFLVFGLTLFGLGEALLIVAGLGVSPWTVFAQGIQNITSFSIGFSTFFVSVLVLLAWLPLKQVPGIGTVLNVIIISLVLDLSIYFLPVFEEHNLRVVITIFGVLITGFGGAIYLISNLGAGPRDGLMVGLQHISNLPIVLVRGGIELTVLTLGWWMGGVVGVGTVLFAFGIGPSVAISLYLLNNFFYDY